MIQALLFDVFGTVVDNGEKTREFINTTLRKHEHSLKKGKTLKGLDGFVGKKGATW